MNAYIYNAALWCEECAKAIKTTLANSSYMPEDPSDESSYDSGDYPKGPFSDGGGEADSAQHCDAGPDCFNAETLSDGRKIGTWLENDLTSDGVKWAEDLIIDDLTEGQVNPYAAFLRASYDGLEVPPALDDLPSPTFERFDICAAYDLAEYLWNSGGTIRPHRESVGVQLARIQYRAGMNQAGYYQKLEENGQAIYQQLIRRLGFVKG